MLEKNAQVPVYKWLKSLRFPDRHASNILRLVNTEECRLFGMKSHDFHVFMQTLIPLAFVICCQRGYGMNSQRSVISSEIYAPAS